MGVNRGIGNYPEIPDGCPHARGGEPINIEAAHSGEALRDRAWFLAGLKRFEESLQACDRAIALEPQNRHLWLEKAAVLSDAGRNHEALALIAQAFEDKAFADEYHRRGQSLLDGLPG